jgi:hypothetical protein
MLFSFYAFSGLGNREDRVISVSADKMNVLYIGIDNPLTVAVEGIKSEDMNVYSLTDNFKVKEKTPGYYTASATTPGIGKLSVEGKGFQAKTVEFRIKRLPDPVATLDGRMDAKIDVDQFKQMEKIELRMNCFPMEIIGEIVSFEIIRVPPKGDPIILSQEGVERFTPPVKKLINQAQPGDTYYFNNIKGRLGIVGENNPPRKLNALVFKIQ